jgi:hypothetical protein
MVGGAERVPFQASVGSHHVYRCWVGLLWGFDRQSTTLRHRRAHYQESATPVLSFVYILAGYAVVTRKLLDVSSPSFPLCLLVNDRGRPATKGYTTSRP